MSEHEHAQPPPSFLPDVSSDLRVPPKEVFLWLQYRAQAAALAHGGPVPLRYADASALVALGALTASLLRSQLGYAKETVNREKTKAPGLCPASLKDATTCCWCGRLIHRITYACPLQMLLPDALRRTLTLDHVVAARPDATAEELRLQNKRYTRQTWYLCTRKCCREVLACMKERFPQVYDDLGPPRLAFLPRVCKGREDISLVSHKVDCPMEERLQHHQMYVVTKEDRADSLRGRSKEVKQLEKEESKFIREHAQERPLLRDTRRLAVQPAQHKQRKPRKQTQHTSTKGNNQKRGRRRTRKQPQVEEINEVAGEIKVEEHHSDHEVRDDEQDRQPEANETAEQQQQEQQQEQQEQQEEEGLQTMEQEELYMDGSETEPELQELLDELPSPIAQPPAEVDGPETDPEMQVAEPFLGTANEAHMPVVAGDEEGFTTEPETSIEKPDDSKTEPDVEVQRQAQALARKKRARTRTASKARQAQDTDSVDEADRPPKRTPRRAAPKKTRPRAGTTRSARKPRAQSTSTATAAQKRRRAVEDQGQDQEQQQKATRRATRARRALEDAAAQDADGEPEREEPPKRTRRSTAQSKAATSAAAQAQAQAQANEQEAEPPAKRARRRPQRYQDELV